MWFEHFWFEMLYYILPPFRQTPIFLFEFMMHEAKKYNNDLEFLLHPILECVNVCECWRVYQIGFGYIDTMLIGINQLTFDECTHTKGETQSLITAPIYIHNAVSCLSCLCSLLNRNTPLSSRLLHRVIKRFIYVRLANTWTFRVKLSLALLRVILEDY